ncbi:MAG: bacterial proteasome activator family protein [Actinomycetota bacterium]|nr:bacterial proteasome activator family protein [Actinomycetota bacterium]
MMSDVPHAQPDLITGPSPPHSAHPEAGESIERPARVMRIGSMTKQLLEEVRQAPLDEESRKRLRDIYESSIEELAGVLSPELRDELDRVVLPFQEASTPTEGELRIAQAQLVGWLEGLFHGIQAALFAQQVAARAQLEEMHRGLPPAPEPDQSRPGYL